MNIDRYKDDVRLDRKGDRQLKIYIYRQKHIDRLKDGYLVRQKDGWINIKMKRWVD